MPTREAYRSRLQPLLTAGLAPTLQAAADDGGFSIPVLAGQLAGILVELEHQHAGASAQLQALAAGRPGGDWGGHGELGFLLYYLHNPPHTLRAELDGMPPLKAVWDAMAEVAPPSPFTPAELERIAAALPEGGAVKCNEWGDIYGTGQYEQLDPGWAWTLKNTAMNHLPRWMGPGFGIADFVRADWRRPLPLEPGLDGKVRVAIIGDWGSGSYQLNGLDDPDGPACAVMDTLARLGQPPDYLIHLGDTYYSGTGPHRRPISEERGNLVDMLRRYPRLARPGRCFTLNSNHEMYGGAWGYYGEALSDDLFSAQRGCSYFALSFGDWILAGIDSAYFDPSNLYMDGGLGETGADPQYDFLRQLAASGKKVLLMSHHTGQDTAGESASTYLWNDVTSVLQPHAWYWGHTHLGIAYNQRSFCAPMLTRCIGHGSMPFAVPPGLRDCDRVDWYSHTPLVAAAADGALYYDSVRARNGFAVLTLSAGGLGEQAFDIGSTTPVWSHGAI